MKARHTLRPRTGGAGVSGLLGLLALLVLTPLLTLAAGPASASPAAAAAPRTALPAQVATLCLPSETVACIAGTLRTESDVVAGVTIDVTGPGGYAESVETGEDGKYQLQVTEPGEYVLALDEDTLPDDVGATGSGEVRVQAQLGRTAAVIIPVRTGDYAAERDRLDYALQSAANGLRLGLLLALAAVGLSLIYGTTGLSNFAHAEQVTLGGILAYFLVNQGGLNLWVGGAVVVLLCAFTGWFQDRVMWQPLRRRGLGLVQMMIVTIGLSLALQYSFQYFVGARTVRVVRDNPEVLSLGPITMTTQSYVAMAIAVVVLTAVGLALTKTRIGQATRAVSDNPALASASGIDVDRVIRLVWTVAAGLAGLGGILYALVTNGIKWDSGLQILLILFAAVTLGGLGTAFGALVGALIVGMVVEMSPVVGVPGDFKYATALLILILLLLVRPQGLLGKPERIG
ncbi:branched-chain amino acid ABC transporter permease [Nocardioides perillae]|uniref:Branched-chain amino acid transport system permease protein n=1 Tax=Nocardioides perillae TaxID=1119534 RepID=A0A7Y9RVL6_9ACTN|nr:branched-chain amino acid ABC transporter permease [Nocardioides perillae]NYG56191.1 branched-chain amino acid transport system permease protein [Nocardioides perillae]